MIGKLIQAPVAERYARSRLPPKEASMLRSYRHSLKAEQYRRKAAACARLTNCAQSVADRDRLSHMREAWLARAANVDWLEGLLPLPPANSNALPIGRYA